VPRQLARGISAAAVALLAVSTASSFWS
jgi:hypothetical protein